MQIIFHLLFPEFVFSILSKSSRTKTLDYVTQLHKKKLNDCGKDRFTTCIMFIIVSRSMKTEMREQNIFGLHTWTKGQKDMQIIEWGGIDKGNWGPRIFKSFPLANAK